MACPPKIAARAALRIVGKASAKIRRIDARRKAIEFGAVVEW